MDFDSDSNGIYYSVTRLVGINLRLTEVIVCLYHCETAFFLQLSIYLENKKQGKK